MSPRKARTREDFLAAATNLFAKRGYYGASLADVAAELGVSKQAVLHRFSTKEKLYGEVLQSTAARLEGQLGDATSGDGPAAEQLLAFFTALSPGPEPAPSTRLVMRELLDNPERAETAGVWYLKDLLDGLVDLVRTAPGWEEASRPRALALVYQLLGAVNYHSISHATLRAMFGDRTYRSLEREFPQQLEATVRAALAAPPAKS